ncbi:MAG: ATP-binding cassette, subfamily bacterial [Acidimicrobiaceae bacterium]
MNGRRVERRRHARATAKASPPRVLRRLFAEARDFRWHLAALALLDLAATPLVLLTPLPVKLVVDNALGSKPVPGPLQPLFGGAHASSGRILFVGSVLQVVVVVLYQFQQAATNAYRTFVGQSLTVRFRSRLFRHVQRLSLSFHDTRGTADSLFRVQYDAPSIEWIVVHGVMQFVSSALMLVAMVVVIAGIDTQLAVVALLVCPPLFFVNNTYSRRVRHRYVDIAVLDSHAMSVAQEVLGSFRVVKAFGREDSEQARYVHHSTKSALGHVRLSVLEGSFGLLVNTITAAGTAVVLYLGARHVQAHTLSLGDLLLVSAYLLRLYAPLESASQQVATLQTSMAGAQRSFELLDQPPDVEDRPDARPLIGARGQLTFTDVSFAYDNSPEVLHGITFHVPAGTRLGLAGHTGSGKTTVVNLLARFYDPTEGQIRLDGIDLRDIRLADLRNQFAIVLQEPLLFSTSIAENIAYARPEATFDEVVAAARAADADRFIEALPGGYDTSVGERGMSLSGGERQRISLARAFLKDAPILILDEPTSAVDINTEAAIVEAMDRLMAGRTTFMIAHRLSTLDLCEAVIELEEGRLVGARGVKARRAPRQRPSVLGANNGRESGPPRSRRIDTQQQRKR